MDMTVAKRRYVLEVMEILPTFKMPTEAQASEPPVPAQDEPEAIRSDTSASSISPAQAPRSHRQVKLEAGLIISSAAAY